MIWDWYTGREEATMPKKPTRRADVVATSEPYQLKLMGILPTYICSKKKLTIVYLVSLD